MKRLLKILSDLNHNYGYVLEYRRLGYLLCFFGFSLTIAAFYPGYMSPDSLGNLAYGRVGRFPDINSPVMSYVWGVLDGIFPGPALMFILQNLIFWSGCAIFWNAAKNKSGKLGVCLILTGFLPQILSQLSTVWKDVGLAVCLFFVSSVLYYSARKNTKIFLFITPLFLFYAYAARLNSITAVFPLTIWTGIVVFKVFDLKFNFGKKAVFVSLFTLIYFSALTFAVYFVNNRLTEGQTVYPFQQVLLYDLAAISKGRNESLFPEYVVKEVNFSLENVKSEYNLRSINTLIYGDRPNKGDSAILKLTQNPQEIYALRAKWFETVSDNQILYLSHRYNIFAQLTGFTTDTVSNPYWDIGFKDNPPEFRREPNLLNRFLMKYFDLSRKPFFFRGFFWLFLSVFCIYKAIKNRFQDDWESVFFLSLSSVLYILAYFPTAPSTEFRYIFWSELSSAVAAVFAFYILIKKYQKTKNSKQLSVVN